MHFLLVLVYDQLKEFKKKYFTDSAKNNENTNAWTILPIKRERSALSLGGSPVHAQLAQKLKDIHFHRVVLWGGIFFTNVDIFNTDRE